MSEKSFLMILGPIWSKIVFKKKSCQICPKILKILEFLNFPKSKNGRKWPELADNYSKTSALPQSLSKIFFCVPNPKIHENIPKKSPPLPKKKVIWGGGDDIKCRFRRVWRSMEKNK